MAAPTTTPHPASAAPGPMDLVRLVMRFNLHPEHDLHPSWLPAHWPARHRVPARLGEGGRAALADLLRRDRATPCAADFNFDSRLKRLALLDARALRRLAAYLGFCAHLPLFRVRGGAGREIRRQACRFDDDAVDFVLDRVPALSELRMNHSALEQRPIAAGRIVLERGHRLLLGAFAPEGEAVLRRLQHKLPRRLSSLQLPQFEPR